MLPGYVWLLFAIGFYPGMIGAGFADEIKDKIRSGGQTTVFETGHNAYSLPAANLDILNRDGFFIGNAFFKNPWVIAPSSTKARDGLGPLFNTNTCQGCHVKDGRGRPPLGDEKKLISMLVRLSVPAGTGGEIKHQALHGPLAEPVYGGQFQGKGIPGVGKEGDVVIDYETLDGTFEDGTPYTLLKPTISFTNLQYGPMRADVEVSARVAPAMVGLGLLEAIDEQDIMAIADPEDTNGDGISGKANRVKDVASGKLALGRFGWKAGQPTVKQQSASAFNGDLGITSSMFPEDTCTAAQKACKEAPHGGKPELTDEILDFVNFYASMLAVPTRRDVDDDQVKAGERLFHQAQCQACHIDTFVTKANTAIRVLSNQTIHPYTDLLLHDMGEGLADHRAENLANGREWRTPPLWGIGLVDEVNGHTRFLHDGRARNLMEAVLWHGGEAQRARDHVLAMSAEERQALMRFLESL